MDSLRAEDDEPTAEWRDGESGRLPLTLTLSDVLSLPRSGAADDAVSALRKVPRIETQLQAMPPADVFRALKSTGGWETCAECEPGEKPSKYCDHSLADHDENLDRVLWIACLDLRGPDYMCPECEQFYVDGDSTPDCVCPECGEERGGG